MQYALTAPEFEQPVSEDEFRAIRIAKQDVLFATVAEETFTVVTPNFHQRHTYRVRRGEALALVLMARLQFPAKTEQSRQ